MGRMEGQRSIYLIDAGLLLAFLVTAAPKLTGVTWHEWLGVAVAIPLLVHVAQHWRWITTVPRRLLDRSLGPRPRLSLLTTALLYVLVLVVMLSGLLSSKELLPGFGLTEAPDRFWSMMHHKCCDLFLPLVGIHLGLHWRWIAQKTRALWARGVGAEVTA